MFFDDDVVVVMLVGGEKRTEGGNWTNTQTEKETKKNKIVKEVVAGEYANNVAGHTAQSRRRRKEKKEKKTHGVQRVSHFGLFVVYLNETTRSSRPDRKTSLLPFLFLLLFYAELRLAVWVVVEAAKYMRPGPDDYSPALCFLGAKGVPPET